MGPVSGMLSDKYGARGFSTLGLVLSGVTFIALSFLPYDFVYLPFAIILFVMGIANGMFAAPNMASIMNSVPPEHRGAASGMRATLQNSGQTISQALFFTIIISALAGKLPSSFATALTNAGAPQLASAFSSVSPTGALFAAFLGENPVAAILSSPQLAQVVSLIPQNVINTLEGSSFFPNAIAPPFMSALDVAFYIGAALSFVAAIASVLRGRRRIHGENEKAGAPSPG
jgi:MFS family permease